MEYKLWDTYMVRTPALPYKYFDEYNKSDCDIYEFISKNNFLDSFFKKSLLIW